MTLTVDIKKTISKLRRAGKTNLLNLVFLRWSKWGNWTRLFVIVGAIASLIWVIPFSVALLPLVTVMYLISCTVKNIVEIANNWKWGPIFSLSKIKAKTLKELEKGTIFANIQDEDSSERMFANFQARGASHERQDKEASEVSSSSASPEEESAFSPTSEESIKTENQEDLK